MRLDFHLQSDGEVARRRIHHAFRGQPHFEHAALIQLAFDRDSATDELDKAPADRQAESPSAVLLAAGFTHLCEFIENRFELLRCNADAAVLHADHCDAIWRQRCRYGYTAMLR